MARRTVNLPDSFDSLVRDMAQEGESFSATIARLLEAGVKWFKGTRAPSYVASGEGPDDLGINAEAYLRNLVSTR